MQSALYLYGTMTSDLLLYLGVAVVSWKQLKWCTGRAPTILLFSVIALAGYVMGHRILKDKTMAETAAP